jgi:hypothetical protein
MYEAAASCKDISRAPVVNWEHLQYNVRRETRNVTMFCYKCGRAFNRTVVQSRLAYGSGRTGEVY